MQTRKARMNISHFRSILFNLKIFGEIVTVNFYYFGPPKNSIIDSGTILLQLKKFYNASIIGFAS